MQPYRKLYQEMIYQKDVVKREQEIQELQHKKVTKTKYTEAILNQSIRRQKEAKNRLEDINNQLKDLEQKLKPSEINKMKKQAQYCL